MSEWLFRRLTGDAYLMAFEKRAVERQQKGEAALEEVRTSIQAARDKVCDPLQLYWWQHCTQKAVLVAALHPENSRAELSAVRS